MKMKWYDFGLELSLLLAVFLTPLVFAPQLNVSFEFIKVATFRSLVLIGVLFFVIKIVMEKQISFPSLGRFRFLWILIAGYFLAILLATLFSSAPKVGFYGVYFRLSGAYTFIHYALFFLLLIFSVREEKQVKRLLFAAFLSSFIVSVNGILQYAFPTYLAFWDTDKFLGRVFSTMGHPNYLATYLIMMIPVSFCVYYATKGFKQWLSLAVFLILFVPLFLTLSRAAFLGLFAGVILFLMIFAAVKKMRKLFLASLIIPLIGILFVASVNVFHESEFVQNVPILNRLVVAGENARSVETRFLMWPATLRMVLDKPFFGYGPDTFSTFFPKYAPKELLLIEDLNSRADRAHNEILDTLVSIGFIGFAFYFALLITIFVVGIKSRNILSFGILSGIFGLFVANQFGFSMVTHYAYFWLFAFLILFYFAGGQRKVLPLRFPSWNVSKGLIILVVFAFVIFEIFTQDIALVRADYYFKKGNSDGYEKGPVAMLDDFKKAAELYPFQSYYSYAVSVLASDLGEHDTALKYVEKGGDFSSHNDSYYFHLGNAKVLSGENFDDAFTKALELAPTYVYTYLSYGEALFSTGNYLKAISIFEKYLDLVPRTWEWKPDLESRTPDELTKYRIFHKLNPGFNAVFVYLARGYFMVNDIEQALYYLQFADDDADTFSTYATIYESLGDMKKAKEYTSRALELRPEDPVLMENASGL